MTTFFKWFFYPDMEPKERPKPDVILNIKRLGRKEKSTYKPSDMWAQEDDILFLKYCPSKRHRAYHMMSRDTSCRPSEILNLKIKDVVFKLAPNGRQYAEILVNGKPGQQQDARDISERYIGKSNPFIVLASTPDRPGSLFDTIEREKEKECIYHRLKLDYTYGIGKIYSKQEIDKARQSTSFSREYDLQYLGLIGSTFHTKDIDRAVELGKKYNPNRVIVESQKVLGLDPGWGSSAFGVCLLQVANSRIEVLMTEEYERPRYQDMADKVIDIIRGLNRRNIDPDYLDNCKIYVDAANPEFITTLKELVGETTRWEYIQDKILYCKKHNLDLARYMNVVPVAFSTSAKDMLVHTKDARIPKTIDSNKSKFY